MHIDSLLVSGTRPSRGRSIATITLTLGALAASAATLCGQGLKITQLAFPGATATYGSGVNSANHVAGVYATSTATKGFEWLGGTHYESIVFKGSNNFTRANGINDAGEIVGDFLSTKDGYYHGFTDVAGTLTQYDAPGGLGHFSTSLFGIDNNGDLAGSAGDQGFVSINGTVTMFYGSGTDLTYAYGINDSQVAVGQYFDSGNLSHGFMWAAGVATEIAFPGATQTGCQGINNSGEITGYYIDASDVGHGFTYKAGVFATSDLPVIEGVNANGAYVGNYYAPPGVSYGYLASPQAFKPATVKIKGAESTSTIGVNNAGITVGQYVDSKGNTHGMMLNGATVTKIDDPHAATGTTFCYGINNNNQVVGFYTDSVSTLPVGFYYANGVFTDIPGPAGATSAEAWGINDNGQITGYFFDSSFIEHGFVLSGPGGVYTQLDVPGSLGTYAWGINNAGTIALGWTDSVGFSEAVLYNGSTYTAINLPGVTFNMAVHSINNVGDVVYSWQDGNGNEHGGLLSGGFYYLLDVPGGSNTRADGINDSGLITGRYNPAGSTTNYDGFKGSK